MALAEHGELNSASLTLNHIRPGQRDEFGDSKASSIANLDEDAIGTVREGRPRPRGGDYLGAAAPELIIFRARRVGRRARGWRAETRPGQLDGQRALLAALVGAGTA